jgi:tetratricopeptide (TPR) repeat protein
VAAVHQDLSGIYASQGRYGDAYKSLTQSLAIYTKLESHDVADVRADLGKLLIAMGRSEEAEKELSEAEHAGGHGHGGHDEGPSPQVLLGRAELAHLRGELDQAAKAYEQANIQANLSKKKEVAVESRVVLGRLYLEQRKLDNAERLLLRTHQEAVVARLRPLEAEAAAVLAEVYLARGQAEPARKAATDAIRIAEKFSGRPTLYRAYATLGEAQEKLKSPNEAMDAYAKAASTLEWIRGSLLPEHVGSFVARADVQSFLRKTVAVLDKGGRTAEAEPLRKWLASPPRVAS